MKRELSGMMAFEHELEPRSLADRERVAVFLDLVSEFPGCCAVFVSNKFLRNKKAVGLSATLPYIQHKVSDVNRNALIKACTSHGHLSVLFVHDRIDQLSQQYLSLGFYGPPTKINFITHDDTGPMSIADSESFSIFLNSPMAKNARELATFSHDAAEFYRIYL